MQVGAHGTPGVSRIGNKITLFNGELFRLQVEVHLVGLPPVL